MKVARIKNRNLQIFVK